METAARLPGRQGEPGQPLPAPAPLGGAAGREPQGPLSGRGRARGRGLGGLAGLGGAARGRQGLSLGYISPRGRPGRGRTAAPGLPSSATTSCLPSRPPLMSGFLSRLGNGFTAGKRRRPSLRPFHGHVFDALPHYVYNRPTRVYGI